MIRQASVIFLTLSFLLQTFSGNWVVMDYWINTGTYAKKCENKARPKLHCKGKCAMMKKLQQEEKKDSQTAERKGSSKTELFFSANASGAEASYILLQTKYLPFHLHLFSNTGSELFQPPRT